MLKEILKSLPWAANETSSCKGYIKGIQRESIGNASQKLLEAQLLKPVLGRFWGGTLSKEQRAFGNAESRVE